MIELTPIGAIHNPFKERSQAPHQGRLSEEEITLVIFHPFAEALKDIESCSHLIVLYWGDRANREALQLRTLISEVPVGFFSSRSTNCPSPIAFYVADLIHREGDYLVVRRVDPLDDSPLLDLKLYAPALDFIPLGTTGNILNSPGKISNGRKPDA
ncbi:MAG: tRNA (N6-threonylcarbamoyladenosine(37)-N6)-methyltransferase TrmO [Anaerolineales bacterium]|nr:tRNA (N6-threonylcarbamoyladenosine(37)-N6)-methyltransferase TrmO [Anaerolineales bacterium]